jgi:predicted ATPase/DNA-binding SARP family transcriptional activator
MVLTVRRSRRHVVRRRDTPTVTDATPNFACSVPQSGQAVAGGVLEFGILGPLEVRRGGEPVELGGAKQRAVLARLLLQPGEPVPVDRLIEDLWGDEAPRTAAHTVQVYVSSLRKALGSEAIRHESGGYLLDVPKDRLDSARFTALAARARAEQPARAATSLREALALWRGPALADFRYESFAQVGIAQLEEERLAAVEERFAAELASEAGPELVPELQSLVAEQPLRERLRAHLMLALYRAGRQAEALEAYQDARATLRDELGIDPSAKLQELYRAILNQEDSLDGVPVDQPPSNLPTPPNALVGRDRELREVRELLGSARLLTLTGAGGSGKTRLALAAAAEVADDFPDGVWLVSLANSTDVALVEPTIASVVGAKDELDQALHDKEMLLVLDNLEQLLPDVALTVARLQPRVLATSRERLNVAGEQEYPVAALAPADAVALFVQRARGLKPGFEPDAAVEEICHRLEGLPLAIELAAARVKVLTPAQILERLSRSLDLLTIGVRDAPERQRTMRAAIAWSYELLTEREQGLFSRLGIFAGGFDLEAAEAVADADLDALASLVDKSLVGQAGDGRFFLLETIRDFALERLAAGRDVLEARRRHARFFLGVGVRAEPEPEASLALLDRELPNFREALKLLRDDDPTAELELAVAISELFRLRGLPREGRLWLEDALPRGSSSEPLQLRALEQVAYFAYMSGDFDAAEARVDQFRRLAEANRDTGAVGRASHLAGLLDTRRGDLLGARQSLLEAVEFLGDDPYASFTYNGLGYVALLLGDTAEARTNVERALNLAGDSHDHRAGGLALLATAALLDGDELEAAGLLLDNLEQEAALGLTPYFASESLQIAAALANARGAFRSAAQLLGAGEASRERSLGRSELGPLFQRLHDDTRSALELALGVETLADECERGRNLSDDDALSLTLSTIGEAAKAPSRD